jgi:hypothetical protein
MKWVVTFACLFGVAMSTMPCNENLFYWVVMVSKSGISNTTAAIVQHNPYNNFETTFYLAQLPVLTASLYDEMDQQV